MRRVTDYKIAVAFGQVLRKHRKRANLTQEEYADRCEVDRTYASLLERGKRHPNLELVFTLCHELGVAPSTVLKEVERALGGRDRIRGTR
ncbi:MAG: helix-turn-helix domain-containing protein [Nevskiales bacterium]